MVTLKGSKMWTNAILDTPVTRDGALSFNRTVKGRGSKLVKWVKLLLHT